MFCECPDQRGCHEGEEGLTEEAAWSEGLTTGTPSGAEDGSCTDIMSRYELSEVERGREGGKKGRREGGRERDTSPVRFLRLT